MVAGTRPLLSALCIGLAFAMTPGEAGAQRGAADAYVTAQSRYGNGSLTAPVRPWQFGHQVQLPGGVWLDCARDCAETLRRQKLDFWETMREERGGNEWK